MLRVSAKGENPTGEGGGGEKPPFLFLSCSLAPLWGTREGKKGIGESFTEC